MTAHRGLNSHARPRRATREYAPIPQALSGRLTNHGPRLRQHTKMNIVHVVPVFNVGGIWRHLFTTIKYSTPGEHHRVVCLFRYKSDFAIESMKSEVRNLQLDPSFYREQSDIEQLLISEFNHLEADIVHSHHFYSDIFAVPAAASLSLPVVRSVHGITQINPEKHDGDRPLRFDWSAMEIERELQLEHHVSQTIAVSHDLERRLQGYGLPKDKISVIHPGVDLDQFAPARIDYHPSPFRVGFIGRLEPIKNPLLIPVVATSTRTKGVSMTFTIVGDGRLRGELEDEISKNDLEGITILPETLLVADQLRQFDALIVPSLLEGLPYVLLEAMACRVPIVASRVGGIPEAIDDRVTGHLCNSGDAEAFAQRLISCSQDIAQTTAMADRAFTEVRTRFSANVKYSQLSKIYRKILPLN